MQEDPSGLAADPNPRRDRGNDPTNATDPSGLIYYRDFAKNATKIPDYDGASLTGKTPDGEKITFTFKAAEYRLGLLNKEDKSSNAVAMRVSIDVNVDSKKYDEIRIIQVYRKVEQECHSWVPARSDVQLRDMLAGFTGDLFPSTPSPGWLVDYRPNKAGGRAGDSFWADQTKVSNHESIFNDQPDLEAQNGPIPRHGKEFITAAIGWKRGKAPEYLGSIEWGFHVDELGDFSASPEKPILHDGTDAPPPQFADCLSRGNKWRMDFTFLPKGQSLEEGEDYINAITGLQPIQPYVKPKDD
jgi:hypothetical protein